MGHYAYDDNGNITSITQGTTSVTYQYNGANELIRENNQFTNQTVTYEYDDWGNIRNKKTYAYPTAAIPTTRGRKRGLSGSPFFILLLKQQPLIVVQDLYAADGLQLLPRRIRHVGGVQAAVRIPLAQG